MENDQQAHEHREDASWLRRFLEHIWLYSIVLFDELRQTGELINRTTRNPIPSYDGNKIVNFTEWGKTLYVKGPSLSALWERKNEEQRITASIVPDGGTYTLAFDGKKTANIPFDGPKAAIQNALDLAWLWELIVTWDLLTGIHIEFGGKYAHKHQNPIKIDSWALTRGWAALAVPPTVERIVPTNNYYIVQQQWGKQLYALIKEVPGGVPQFVPAIPYFFTKDFQIFRKEGVIAIQAAQNTPKIRMPLRQGA